MDITLGCSQGSCGVCEVSRHAEAVAHCAVWRMSCRSQASHGNLSSGVQVQPACPAGSSCAAMPLNITSLT